MDPHIATARRFTKFPEKLMRHGFYENNSLLAAEKNKLRQKSKEKKKLFEVKQVLGGIDDDIAYMSKLQGKVRKMQQTLEYEFRLRIASIRVQTWFRMISAKFLLRRLKLTRYVVDRWKFVVYYHKRLMNSMVIVRAFRYYHLRCAYLIIKNKIKFVRKIQRFYRTFKFRMIARLMIVILRVTHKTIPRCIFFAERRALYKIIIAKRLTDEEKRVGAVILALWKRKLRNKRIQILAGPDAKLVFFQMLEYHYDLQAENPSHGTDLACNNNDNADSLPTTEQHSSAQTSNSTIEYIRELIKKRQEEDRNVLMKRLSNAALVGTRTSMIHKRKSLLLLSNRPMSASEIEKHEIASKPIEQSQVTYKFISMRDQGMLGRIDENMNSNRLPLNHLTVKTSETVDSRSQSPNKTPTKQSPHAQPEGKMSHSRQHGDGRNIGLGSLLNSSAPSASTVNIATIAAATVIAATSIPKLPTIGDKSLGAAAGGAVGGAAAAAGGAVGGAAVDNEQSMPVQPRKKHSLKLTLEIPTDSGTDIPGQDIQRYPVIRTQSPKSQSHPDNKDRVKYFEDRFVQFVHSPVKSSTNAKSPPGFGFGKNQGSSAPGTPTSASRRQLRYIKVFDKEERTTVFDLVWLYLDLKHAALKLPSLVDAEIPKQVIAARFSILNAKHPVATPRANVKFIHGKSPTIDRRQARPPIIHRPPAQATELPRTGRILRNSETSSDHATRRPSTAPTTALASAVASQPNKITVLSSTKVVLPSQIARAKKKAALLQQHDATQQRQLGTQRNMIPAPPTQLRRSKADIAPRLAQVAARATITKHMNPSSDHIVVVPVSETVVHFESASDPPYEVAKQMEVSPRNSMVSTTSQATSSCDSTSGASHDQSTACESDISEEDDDNDVADAGYADSEKNNTHNHHRHHYHHHQHRNHNRHSRKHQSDRDGDACTGTGNGSSLGLLSLETLAKMT